MDKLDKAKEIVRENIDDARFGIYDTRNLVGDEMTVIYDDWELMVEVCYPYGYFEVFGLTTEQFKELETFYFSLVRYR